MTYIPHTISGGGVRWGGGGVVDRGVEQCNNTPDRLIVPKQGLPLSFELLQ